MATVVGTLLILKCFCRHLPESGSKQFGWSYWMDDYCYPKV